MAAGRARAAHRRGDTYPAGHEEEGDPTVEAIVGMLLEEQGERAAIQTARATAWIAARLGRGAK